MPALHHHLRAHVRLAVAVGVGLVLALLLPADWAAVQRALLGWNLAVWLYLAMAAWMMGHASHGHLRQVADAQADSAGTVLVLVSVACIVSLGGTVLELGAAKAGGSGQALAHIGLAVATVLGAWLLLPVVFALTYASHYFGRGGGGLQFAGADGGFKPGYADFLYLSFTIACAAQTSDVAITTPAMRRLVAVHSVLSFGFNTAVLALTINLAAGLF